MLPKILSIVKLVSEIILIWGILLYGYMKIQGATDCMEFGSPNSTLSLKRGTICSTILEGTQYFAPLSVLRERRELLGK